MQGLKVLGIREQGPIDRAGIRQGEHLLRFDGMPLRCSKDLKDYMAETTPGDIFDVRIIRSTPACYQSSIPVCSRILCSIFIFIAYQTLLREWL